MTSRGEASDSSERVDENDPDAPGAHSHLGLPTNALPEETVHVGGADRYTMAEAARLKGVSYHTVSRAVRRGRLPVQRLGRMALIAADDLAAWRPMKERAPRRYQQRATAPDALPGLKDRFDGDAVLALHVAGIGEEIHGLALTLPMATLAGRVLERYQQIFQLDRAAIWHLDEEATVAERIIRSQKLVIHLPSRIPVADFAFVRNLVSNASSARMVFDMRAEDPLVASYFGPADHLGPCMLAPMRVCGRLTGFIFGDRDGAEFNFSEQELAVAQRVANQIAIALESARMRETSLRQQRMLEAIIDELPTSIVATDPNGVVVVSNREHAEFVGTQDRLGRPYRELAGRIDERWLASDDLARREIGLFRTLDGEDVPQYEYTQKREGRPDRHWLLSHRRLEYGGEVLGAVSTARDVTTIRENAERRAQHLAALELARRKAETVAQVVTDVNAGKTVREVIETAIARLVDELEGRSGLVALRNEEGAFKVMSTYRIPGSPAARESFNPMTQPNTTLAFAQRAPVAVRREDAGLAEREIMEQCGWKSLLIVPFQLGNEHLGFAFVGYDVSNERVDLTFAATLGVQCTHAIEKVRLIEAVESVHRRLLTVIDQLPQAVVIVEPTEGLVTMANKAADELWGMPLRARPVRATELTLLDADGQEIERDLHPLIRSVRTGRAQLGEPLTVRQASGETVEVLSNHAPVFAANGTIAGGVSVLQDRAHLKPLERVRDEFLSVVAHELRSPLTALRGNLQLLGRRVRRDRRLTAEEGARRIATLLEQVDRLTGLVTRLLDVSRADLGRLDVTPAPADGAALVRKVSAEAAGMVPDRRIILTAPETVPVIWDHVRIEQILTNLLSNASRYAPEGAIEVTLREEPGDRILISVRDHGPGIPARIRPRLFRQYYRFDDGRGGGESTDGHRQGLGIGLYLSERLAVAQGGELTVDDAEGGGTIFTLAMPRNATIAAI